MLLSPAAAAPQAFAAATTTTTTTATASAPAPAPAATAAAAVAPASKPKYAGMGIGESYAISDREESSDEDYDSDGGNGEKGGKGAVKRVPDWAKGPALREALESQFNKKQKVDPDTIFPEVRTCDLEEIFKSYQAGGGAAKKRAYRQRQSTGNWQRDGLSSAEKIRYREDMGYEEGC